MQALEAASWIAAIIGTLLTLLGLIASLRQLRLAQASSAGTALQVPAATYGFGPPLGRRPVPPGTPIRRPFGVVTGSILLHLFGASMVAYFAISVPNFDIVQQTYANTFGGETASWVLIDSMSVRVSMVILLGLMFVGGASLLGYLIARGTRVGQVLVFGLAVVYAPCYTCLMPFQFGLLSATGENIPPWWIAKEYVFYGVWTIIPWVLLVLMVLPGTNRYVKARSNERAQRFRTWIASAGAGTGPGAVGSGVAAPGGDDRYQR